MNIIAFITVLAWIFGILATLKLIIRLLSAHFYTNLDEIKDAVKGITRTFPITQPGIIAIICWAWIFSQ